MSEDSGPNPNRLGTLMRKGDYAKINLQELAWQEAGLPDTFGQPTFAVATIGGDPDNNVAPHTVYFSHVTDRSSPGYLQATDRAEAQGVAHDGDIMIVAKDNIGTSEERITGVGFGRLGEEVSEEANAKNHAIDDFGSNLIIGTGGNVDWVAYDPTPEKSPMLNWNPFGDTVEKKQIVAIGSKSNYLIYNIAENGEAMFLSAPSAEFSDVYSDTGFERPSDEDRAPEEPEQAPPPNPDSEERGQKRRRFHRMAQAAGSVVGRSVRKSEAKKQPLTVDERADQIPGFEYHRGSSMTIQHGPERRDNDLPDFMGQRRLADIIIGGLPATKDREELDFERLVLLRVTDRENPVFSKIMNTKVVANDTKRSPFALAAITVDEEGTEQIQAITFLGQSPEYEDNVIGRHLEKEDKGRWVECAAGGVDEYGTPFTKNVSISRQHLNINVFPNVIMISQLSREMRTKINAPRNAEYIPLPESKKKKKR